MEKVIHGEVLVANSQTGYRNMGQEVKTGEDYAGRHMSRQVDREGRLRSREQVI